MKIADNSTGLTAGKLQEKESWQAHLELGFIDDAGVSRLARRVHSGPLRVQKSLYPEGERLCHAIVVHPPGGVVGGDRLSIGVKVGHGAQAFVTTPGAAKWYKANGRRSGQSVALQIDDNARLEWLPQETIFFDAAWVELDTDIVLGKDASFIGWETLCFGRTASGESFASGRIAQRISIRQNGKLVWFEQGDLTADSAMMHSPLGLNGKTVCSTLIAVGKPLPTAMMGSLREALAEAAQDGDAYGVTQLKTVTVVRCLSGSSENARHVMSRAWQLLRPAVMERPAVIPRIWNT